MPEDPARDCYVTPTGCAVCGNPFTGAPTSATAATPAGKQLTGVKPAHRPSRHGCHGSS